MQKLTQNQTWELPELFPAALTGTKPHASDPDLVNEADGTTHATSWRPETPVCSPKSIAMRKSLSTRPSRKNKG